LSIYIIFFDIHSLFAGKINAILTREKSDGKGGMTSYDTERD
jgi:hypothetical protein